MIEHEIFNLGVRLERTKRDAQAVIDTSGPRTAALIRAGLHALDVLAEDASYDGMAEVLDHLDEHLAEIDAAGSAS